MIKPLFVERHKGSSLQHAYQPAAGIPVRASKKLLADSKPIGAPGKILRTDRTDKPFIAFKGLSQTNGFDIALVLQEEAEDADRIGHDLVPFGADATRSSHWASFLALGS